MTGGALSTTSELIVSPYHEAPGESTESTESTRAATSLRDIVRRLHETSERSPDVRAVPMRLVQQDVFDELLAAAAAMRTDSSRDAEFMALREALARRLEEHGDLHAVVVAADAWRDDPCKGLGSHREADLAAAVDFYRGRRASIATAAAQTATRDERIALAERVVRGSLAAEDVLRPDAEVIADGWTVAIDVATFERGIALRNAIAEAVFDAEFPAFTTHSPMPLPDTTRCRLWIVVHLGAEAAS